MASRYAIHHLKKETIESDNAKLQYARVNNRYHFLTYLQLSSGMSHGFQQVDIVRNMNENAIVKTILTNQVAFWKW